MSYDPSKKYVWSPDEKIEITGQEFAVMLNAVRSVLNLPEAPAIILANQANMAIDSVMERYVEAGAIKAVDAAQPPQPPQPPLMKVENGEETNA